jgi:hypothetical protein
MAAAAPIALGLQVAGKITEGIEANRAARAQARVDDENARLSILEGEQLAQRTREDERMQAGAMLAAMAGSGVQLGSGSAADVLAESAYQRELEVLNLRTRATHQARNLHQSAEDRRAAGRAAIIQGVFGAGATALQGISDLRERRTASNQRAQERRVVLGGGTAPVPKMNVVGVGR